MEEYDVGILSFWNVPNYGTFAQAYALQRVADALCKTRDVRQIAYINKKHYKSYYSLLPTSGLLKKTFYFELPKYINIFSNHNRRRKLFLDSYATIPHTDDLSKEQLRQTDFDTVILGSDIIWDYSFEMFGRDPFLFGNHLSAKNAVAYAASFGTIKRGSKYPQYVIDGISKLDAISVRDENSADIVQDITGSRPDIVLDPTWLWDFNADNRIVLPDFSDYMVVYGQDFTQDFVQDLIIYARKEKMKLVCLDCNNDNYHWCDFMVKQYRLTPFEWIGLFRGANAVATSTYHGLTFALIFNKPLAFCQTDFIIKKASSLFEKFGLLEWLGNKRSTVHQMMDYEWDYDMINRIMEEEKKRAVDFLRQNTKK